MYKELVVSAYSRDYSWIKFIKSDVKTIVYRKGSEAIIRDNEIYISKNVGRDVHTFFYHIVNNYNFLADYTFTSQDYPFDHVSNYINLINGNESDWKSYSKLNISDCWFFNDDSYHGRIFTCDKYGCPNHCNIDIEKIWKQLFLSYIPDVIRFVPAGHFCISKETIKSRPIEFYEKIVSILENDKDSPWIIERLEPYIFDTNFLIN